MKKTDLAWAAGLFDGEGCVVVRYTHSKPRGRSIRTQIEISMVARPCIMRLHSLFNVGSVVHFKRRGRNDRTQWRWVAKGKYAALVGRKLLPYLSLKRNEMKILISVVNKRTGQQGHRISEHPRVEKWIGAKIEQMKKLKRREWI